VKLSDLGNNASVRKPGDTYNTPLGFLDELAFRQWVADNHVPFDPNAQGPTDYDMRGFYQGLQQQNPHAVTGENQNDGKMHFSDYWKTPLHQSFSSESQWAGPTTPSWNSLDQLVTPGGRIVFDERRPTSLADLVGMR
jgi:hypothetical protein